MKLQIEFCEPRTPLTNVGHGSNAQVVAEELFNFGFWGSGVSTRIEFCRSGVAYFFGFWRVGGFQLGSNFEWQVLLHYLDFGGRGGSIRIEFGVSGVA